MAADRTGRVWDGVRKALGRMAGRVSSRSLPEAHAGITAMVRPFAVLEFAEIGSGARQEEWRAVAQVRGLALPAAGAGGHGVDPAALTTVIGADRALAAANTDIVEAPCRFAEAFVHDWVPEPGAASVSAAHGETVRLARPPVRRAVVAFGLATTQAGAVCRFAALTPGPDDAAEWRIRPSRVRAGMAPILRIPMTCLRLAATPDAEAFASQRRLLAVAADIPEADVALVGVFPHVPLGAAHKLSVTSDGTALQVWVRPGTAGRGMGTVTVLLGRHRATGKILQAVRRADAEWG